MEKEKGKALIDEIISVTRNPFTDKVYDNISLRDSANELNISVGNLNYYYPKKEDLLRGSCY